MWYLPTGTVITNTHYVRYCYLRSKRPLAVWIEFSFPSVPTAACKPNHVTNDQYLFRTLLANITSLRGYLPMCMIMRRLCNNLTTVMDLNQFQGFQQRTYCLQPRSVSQKVTIKIKPHQKAPRFKYQMTAVASSIYWLATLYTFTISFAYLNHSSQCGIDA